LYSLFSYKEGKVYKYEDCSGFMRKCIEIDKVESMLKKLSSDEAKYMFIRRLAAEKLIPKKYILSKISECENKSMFKYAGMLSTTQNLSERAIINFENAQWYGIAGTVAEGNGLFEKAIECYTKEEWYDDLGELYEKTGDFEKALINYEKRTRFKDSLRVAKKMGDLDRVKFYIELQNTLVEKLDY